MDDLLTVAEVAQRLNTSVRFVRRLIEERRIAFHKLGRHVRVDAGDLSDFIAASRIGALEPATRDSRRVA